MKRSKIYLGITTALLAVAGVAVAKHSRPSFTAYYVTHDQGFCLSASSTCTSSGTVQCTFNTGSHSVKLFTEGPVGAFTGNACTVLLKHKVNGESLTENHSN